MFMTYHPHSPADDDAYVDAADLQETVVEIAMAERHQRLLARLADIGMELVEALAERIKADPASLGDAALSYSRVAQAIRRTLALEVLTRNGLKDQRLHLSTERKTRQANAKAAREAGQAAIVEAKRQKKRSEISDIVNAAIGVTDPDCNGEKHQSLLDDIEELLDDTEYFGDFETRPLGENVAMLCAELGLDPDFAVWNGQHWVIKPVSRRTPIGIYAADEPIRSIWPPGCAPPDRPAGPPTG